MPRQEENQIPEWSDIESSEKYKSLDYDSRLKVRGGHFDQASANNEKYVAADDIKKKEIRDGWMSQEQRPEDSTVMTDVKDVGAAFMRGAASIPNVAGQALEFVGAEDTGKALKQVGKETSDYWDEKISKSGKVTEREGVLSDKEGQVFSETPIKSILMGASGSIPGMIAMAPLGAPIAAGAKAIGVGGKVALALQKSGVTGRIARRLGHLAPSALGYGSAEGVYAGLENANSAGQEVGKMSDSDLSKSPYFNQLLSKYSGDTAKAREELRNTVEAQTFIRTAPVTAGIGVATGGGALGKMARKTKGGVLKNLLEGAREEGIQETFQSGAEQIAGNTVTQDYIDPNQDILEGAGEAMVQGGAAGALLGAAGGGAKAYSSPQETIQPGTIPLTDTISEKPEVQPVPTGPISSALSKADTGALLSSIQGENAQLAENDIINSMADTGQQMQETEDVKLRKQNFINLPDKMAQENANLHNSVMNKLKSDNPLSDEEESYKQEYLSSQREQNQKTEKLKKEREELLQYEGYSPPVPVEQAARDEIVENQSVNDAVDIGQDNAEKNLILPEKATEQLADIETGNGINGGEKQPKSKGQVHDYSNTQIAVTGKAASKIIELGSKIPESEIYTDKNDDSFGRETEPHVTVRYGLATDNPKDISALSELPPITAKMGNVSIFETDNYDVVKVGIDSDSIRSANKKVGELVDIPGETFKDYQPHATIAYVKKGEGKKYVGNNSLKGEEISVSEIDLTTRDGKTHKIKLTGKPESGTTSAKRQRIKENVTAKENIREEKSTTIPEEQETITTKSGSPFKTEAGAKIAISRAGEKDYTIKKVTGGFVGDPVKNVAEQKPTAQTTKDKEAAAKQPTPPSLPPINKDNARTGNGKEPLTRYLGEVENETADTETKRRQIGEAKTFHEERRNPKDLKQLTAQRDYGARLPEHAEKTFTVASKIYQAFKNAQVSVAENKRHLAKLFDKAEVKAKDSGSAFDGSVTVEVRGREFIVHRPVPGKAPVVLNIAGRNLRDVLKQQYKDANLLEFDPDQGAHLNAQPSTPVVNSAAKYATKSLEQAAIEHVELMEELGYASSRKTAIKNRIEADILPLMDDNGIDQSWSDTDSETTFWVSRKPAKERWVGESQDEYKERIAEIEADPTMAKEGEPALSSAGVSESKAMGIKRKEAEALATEAVDYEIMYSISNVNIPTEVTNEKTGESIDVAKAAQDTYSPGMKFPKFNQGMKDELGKTYSKVRKYIRELFNDIVTFSKKNDANVAIESVPKNVFSPAEISIELSQPGNIGRLGVRNLERKGLLEIVSPKRAGKILGLSGAVDITTQGFTININGKPKTFLVQGNVKAGTGMQLLSHEIAEHIYSLNFKDSKQYGRIISQLNRKSKLNNKEGQEIREALARIPADTKPENREREAMAYLLEQGKTNLSIVRRFISEIKKFLIEKMGMNPIILKNIDLQALALNVVKREALASSKVSLQTGTSETVPKFSQTGTTIPENLRRWFGNSKLKDKTGKPIVAYHGSPTEFYEFGQADKRGKTGHTSSGLGDFFSLDKATSSKYGNVKQFYLKMENPYMMGLEESQSFKTLPESVKRKEELQAKGHDSIMIKVPGKKPGTMNPYLIVFEGDQVKSADSNTGEYSLTDRDVRYSMQAEPQQARRQTTNLNAHGSKVTEEKGRDAIKNISDMLRRVAKMSPRSDAEKELLSAYTNLESASTDPSISTADKLSFMTRLIMQPGITAETRARLPIMMRNISAAKRQETKQKYLDAALVTIRDDISKRYRSKIVKSIKRIAGQVKEGTFPRAILSPELQEDLVTIRKAVRMSSVPVFDENDPVKSRLQSSFADLKGKSIDELVAAADQVKHLKITGKANVRAVKDVWEKNEADTTKWLNQEITGKESPIPETPAQAAIRRRKERTLKGKVRGISHAVENSIINWEFILDKIAVNSGKKTFNSRAVTELASVSQAGKRDKESFDRKSMDEFTKAGERILGVTAGKGIKKALGITNKLTKKLTEFSTNPQDVRAGEEVYSITPVQASYWSQVRKDPESYQIFKKMGFTQETWADIDAMITPELKEWSDYLVDDFVTKANAGEAKSYIDIHGVAQKNKGLDWQRKDQTEIPAMSLHDAALNRVLNANHARAWNGPSKMFNDIFKNKETRGYIEQYHGTSTLKAIDSFLEDFSKSPSQLRGDMKALDKLRANVVTAMIGANPTTFFKQLTSMPAYASDIPTSDFIKNFAYGTSHPSEVIAMMKSSGMAADRFGKGYERDVRDISKTTSEQMVGGVKSVKDILMMMTKLGDMTAVASGFTVYKYWHDKTIAGGGSEASAKKIAMAKFEAATERTQQAGGTADLGWVQRHSSLSKLFTMYMTSPASYTRQTMAAMRGMKTDPIGSSKRLLIFNVMLPMMFQAVASGLVGIGGEDEDEWADFWKKEMRAVAMGPMLGIPIARDIAAGIWDSMMGKWYGSDISHSPVTEVGKSLSKSVFNLSRGIGTGEHQSYVKAGNDFSDFLGYMSGLPTKPMKRLMEGWEDLATGKTEHKLLAVSGYSRAARNERIEQKKIPKRIRSRLSRYKRMLKRAEESGNKHRAEQLKDRITQIKNKQYWN